MENDLATIWMRIRRKGRKNLIIGAIYRELRQLQPQQTGPNMSGNINLQINRWARMINQWKKAAKLGDTVVTGDLNLDQLRWQDPPQHHRVMVDMLKEQIEAEGFHQVISGHTRSWRGHRDSSLDHVWTDKPDMIISTRNVTRAYSDHHVVCANLRLNGIEQPNEILMRRNMKHFSADRYREKLKLTNWDTLYDLNDVDKACSFLQSRIQEVLNEECPLRTIQTSKKDKKLDIRIHCRKV